MRDSTSVHRKIKSGKVATSMVNQENKPYILSLSYGKDSLACLGAIEQLGWPLDRIIHAEIWATDTIPADLPPMLDFKKKADKIIKDRWGIEVEHITAPLTYEKIFYRMRTHSKIGNNGKIYGWPTRIGPWCTEKLKKSTVKTAQKNCNVYLGIAADEPERIDKNNKPGFMMPLVTIGWDEAYCRKWCEENDLLSPIYTTATRGGCWFCHNQPVEQLRLLRKNYPELWALMLKWDANSPVPFRSDGHTLHDYDLRFQMEDTGSVPSDHRFRWDPVLKARLTSLASTHA